MTNCSNSNTSELCYSNSSKNNGSTSNNNTSSNDDGPFSTMVDCRDILSISVDYRMTSYQEYY